MMPFGCFRPSFLPFAPPPLIASSLPKTKTKSGELFRDIFEGDVIGAIAARSLAHSVRGHSVGLIGRLVYQCKSPAA